MRASTSTRTFMQSFGSEKLRDSVEIVTKLHELGFSVLDFNFNWGIDGNPDYILLGDDWQKKIEAVADTANRVGVSFSQAHLPFIKGCCRSCDPKFEKSGYAEFFNECIRRAYIACSMLGVKYVTAHPNTHDEVNFERCETLSLNRRFYDEFIELGIRNDVGTAFENMMPCFNGSLPVRYCQHYDELIELVDSYNDSMVAICWDTGHANGMKFDQARAIRTIGKRLKNLHINDNHNCNRDEHLLPFMGTIDWRAVMNALADIDYEGDMTLEVHFGNNAYDTLQEEMIRMQKTSVEFLIGMFEQAKQKH